MILIKTYNTQQITGLNIIGTYSIVSKNIIHNPS